MSGGSDEYSAGEDIVELGSARLPVRWRPPLAVILAIAGLLVGLAGGYAAGAWHAGKAAPLSRSRAAAPEAASMATGPLTLSQAGPQCSAHFGHELQLGLQVTNLSATGVTLRRVEAVLPLGGLKATAQAWGTCGELPAASETAGNTLPAGASTWFTVTFQVLVTCPGPLPVQFVVDYDQRGRPGTIQLPGFDDLGQVPYPGCA